jgi:hypothetical protein
MHLTIGKTKRVIAYLLILWGCMFLNGCDVLEADVDPDNPHVEITDKAIYVMSDGTGYIDLYAMIKTQGTVRLDIVSQPRNGKLSEMGKGLFQYTPANNFRKGKDSFAFHIYSQNNRLLKEDSVTIIVESDTTGFPQGIYPQNDLITGVTGEITFNVLYNDILGTDSTQVGVEIYRPASGFPPHAGTATVVAGNLIRYTPGNNFNGSDSLFYKVFSLADPARFGIAKVVIAPAPSCQFRLFNDSFAFDADTLTTDTLWLNIFQNDQLCARPVSSYQVELLNDGSIGTAFYSNAGSLGYRLPGQGVQSFSDSVIYRVCYGQRCEASMVYIEVHR